MNFKKHLPIYLISIISFLIIVFFIFFIKLDLKNESYAKKDYNSCINTWSIQYDSISKRISHKYVNNRLWTDVYSMADHYCNITVQENYRAFSYKHIKLDIKDIKKHIGLITTDYIMFLSFPANNNKDLSKSLYSMKSLKNIFPKEKYISDHYSLLLTEKKQILASQKVINKITNGYNYNLELYRIKKQLNKCVFSHLSPNGLSYNGYILPYDGDSKKLITNCLLHVKNEELSNKLFKKLNITTK